MFVYILLCNSGPDPMRCFVYFASKELFLGGNQLHLCPEQTYRKTWLIQVMQGDLGYPIKHTVFVGAILCLWF